MDEIEKVKEEFLHRVGELDEKLEYFRDNFESWISSLPGEIVPIVLKMVSSFDYYGKKNTNKILEQFHRTLNDEHKIPDNLVLHTYIKKAKGKICSSLDYFCDYKIINNINKRFCSDDVREIPDDIWKKIKYIVVVDDCCGTGGSLEKFIRYTKKDFTGKHLFYMVIHMLADSIDKIDELRRMHEMQITVLRYNFREKAFDCMTLDNLKESKEIFVSKCKEIGVDDDYSLGKYKSEGLMAFHNNTPNNTIGIFWKETKNNKAIFPRDFGEVPGWEMRPNEMKRQRNERKRMNYMAVKKHG